MKTQMTITVDSETKEAFSAFAKSIGTNSSNLANMLFMQVSRKRKISFDESDVLGFESFSEAEHTSLMSDSSVEKNTKILESLLS